MTSFNNVLGGTKDLIDIQISKGALLSLISHKSGAHAALLLEMNIKDSHVIFQADLGYGPSDYKHVEKTASYHLQWLSGSDEAMNFIKLVFARKNKPLDCYTDKREEYRTQNSAQYFNKYWYARFWDIQSSQAFSLLSSVMADIKRFDKNPKGDPYVKFGKTISSKLLNMAFKKVTTANSQETSETLNDTCSDKAQEAIDRNKFFTHSSKQKITQSVVTTHAIGNSVLNHGDNCLSWCEAKLDKMGINYLDKPLVQYLRITNLLAHQPSVNLNKVTADFRP